MKLIKRSNILFVLLLLAGTFSASIAGAEEKADAGTENKIFYPDPPVPGPGKIIYANPNPPEFTLPEYSGERYEALVPATLDLAERAKIALNALTEMVNENCDYEIFFQVVLMAQPPTMLHIPSDLAGHGKFMAVMPMMRVMSGSRQNLDMERGVVNVQLKMQGPDGLMYTPTTGGRDWVLPSTFDPASGLPGINDGYDQVCLFGYGTARSLGALNIYAQLDPDGPWAEAARRLVEGYKANIVEDGKYAHIFSTWTTPGRRVVKKENPFGEHIYLAGSQAWIALALAQHDRAQGDDRALELAEKMMNYNYLRVEYNEPDGRFKFGGPKVGAGKLLGKCAHFHTHAMNILAALYVAQRTGNRVLFERALKAYNYGVSQGETLVGFFPMVTYDEYVGAQTSETCEVADMVMCGIFLSKMGVDKWDDVDRWTRNQLAENQLTQVNWVTDGHLDYSRSKMPENFFQPDRCTTDRVAERSRGSFAGWPSANDWVSREDWWGGDTHNILHNVMNCCTGSGCRALYYVWQHMISHEDGKLSVHLLMNRASRWADIESHIPYSGRVDIKVKTPVDLEVRLPEWVKAGEAECTVDGEEKPLLYRGRYAVVGPVSRGQTVKMTFPIWERVEKRTIEGFDYTFIVKGNDVVHVDPPGKYHPLYQRSHYRQGKTLYRKVTRFVADEELNWW